MDRTISERIGRASYPVVILVFLITFVTTGSAVAKGKREEKRDYSNDVAALAVKVTNRESIAAVIKKEFEKPIYARKYFPFEQRLVDAEFFFEIGRYDNAAVILSDLVERPEIKQRSDRYYIINKLATALYLDGNYFAGRRYFKELLTPAAGKYYQNALAALMEISLKLHDFTDEVIISEIVNRMDIKSLAPETLYSYGKYLFTTGNRVKSVELFLSIPTNSPYYLKGLYFIGTALVGMKQYDNARKYFSHILEINPTGEKDKVIFDLARLAVARIDSSTGKLDEAISNYVMLEPESPVYRRALYEQAWIFLRKKDYEGALHPIDLLLLSSDNSEPELDILAKTLKGRILTNLNRLSDASEVYAEVVKDYYPIDQELKMLSSNEEELLKYFSSFLYKESEKFSLELPMTEKASKWLSGDRDMAAILNIFNGISIQRKDIQGSLDTLHKIKWALKDKNRIEMMPEAKKMLLKIQEEENQIILLLIEIADLLKEMSLPALVEKETYGNIHQARKSLEGKFRGIPVTTKDYGEREKKISEEYFRLQQHIYNLETVLQILRQQILSAEDWIKGEEFKGGKEKAEERMQDFLNQIKAEKNELKNLYEQLSSLKNEVEMSLLSMKAGSELALEEQRLKLALLNKLAEEVAYLEFITHKLSEPEKSLASMLVSLASRLAALYNSFEPTKKTIDQHVETIAAEYEGIVKHEEGRLAGYHTLLNSLELNSLKLIREIGFKLFMEINARLAQSVLEADLGVIDIAWKLKELESEKIQRLADEKSAALMKLEEDFKSVQK